MAFSVYEDTHVHVYTMISLIVGTELVVVFAVSTKVQEIVSLPSPHLYSYTQPSAHTIVLLLDMYMHMYPSKRTT